MLGSQIHLAPDSVREQRSFVSMLPKLDDIDHAM